MAKQLKQWPIEYIIHIMTSRDHEMQGMVAFSAQIINCQTNSRLLVPKMLAGRMLDVVTECKDRLVMSLVRKHDGPVANLHIPITYTILERGCSMEYVETHGMGHIGVDISG